MSITASIPVTVTNPVYTTIYRTTLDVSKVPAVVPPGVLAAPPGNFVNQTMLQDTSGQTTTYAVTPYNTSQATVAWSSAWSNLVTTSQSPNAYRTPIVQAQADAPGGYAMRTHVDITPSGTDIQRKVTYTMNQSWLVNARPTLHCRLKYRFGAAMSMASVTPTNMKFMRFKQSGTVSYYLFSPFFGGNPRWSFAADNPTYNSANSIYVNNQAGITQSTATCRPRASDAYLTTEVGLTMIDSSTMRYRMWDEGFLCQDSTITLLTPFTAGVKVIDIFDTMNTPQYMYDYYWLPPVIANDYIGP